MKHGTPRLLLDLTPLDTPSGPRGIGRYIRELAIGLSELPASELAGIDLVGLTSLDWTGRCTLTRDLASFQGSRQTPSTERDFYVWAYRQRVALWRAARRVGASAVHVCDPHATPLLLRMAGVKKIVTCHDLVGTRFPDRYLGPKDGGQFIGKQIEKRRYRSAELVVAISDATKEDVRSLLHVPTDRVTRVYNGVDVDRWMAIPALSAEATLKRFGLLGQRFVLYVGGSDWRKNVEGMMGGLAEARALGAEVTLAWAGHLDPSHVAAVEAAAMQAGVPSSVRRLGFVTDDELSVLYRAAIAHLLVSRLEGFGYTVVEAMASGCPVVTTRGGSLAEVAGDAAVVVDPDDHRSIGVALARLVREPSLRRSLTEAGLSRAPGFARRVNALAMAGVYRRFLGAEPASRR